MKTIAKTTKYGASFAGPKRNWQMVMTIRHTNYVTPKDLSRIEITMELKTRDLSLEYREPADCVSKRHPLSPDI